MSDTTMTVGYFLARADELSAVQPELTPAVRLALAVATYAHDGQLDKSGNAYIDHPIGVAMLVDTEKRKVIALLHDVPEDTEVPEEFLRLLFGDEIVDSVMLLTLKPGQTRDEYLLALVESGDEDALAVKLADVANNTDPARTSLLEESVRSRLRRKYERTAELLGTTLDAIHTKFSRV